MDICIISRDKYSTLPSMIRYLLSDLSVSMRFKIIVFNNGYPKVLIKECQDIVEKKAVEFCTIDFPEYLNTNSMINEYFITRATSDYFVIVENDCLVKLDTLIEIKRSMEITGIAIATPIILNMDQSNHFRPTENWIEIKCEQTKFALNRGRTDQYFFDQPIGKLEQQDIIERHCLVINKHKFCLLGRLDEKMHDRTDVDLSIQMKSKKVVAGVHFGRSAIFMNTPSLKWDKGFLEYRWSIELCAEAHRRFLSKWKISGYKNTINHVYEIRAHYLGDLQTQKDCFGNEF